MKFHTIYNRPPRVVSPHGGKSLAAQEYKDESDINVILKRYASGDNSVVRSSGVFADVSQLGDFQTQLEVVRRATEDFAALPAEVRSRFGNDPAVLVAFLADPSHDEEAIKLGLKVRPSVEPSLSEQITEGVTNALAKKASAASVETLNT